jgi:hypothetical protein
VAESLVGLNVDVVLMKESLRGKGPLYVLGDPGVETHHTGATTPSEALGEATQV